MTKSFEKIYEQIISQLQQKLPKWLSYHDANHTKYVIEKAEMLAHTEKISGNELELVKFAALYHDTGFLISRNDHENKGCLIASKDLSETALKQADQDKICGMIRATKIPQRPQNILEKIVADADLFYLGTSTYKEFSHKLFLELKHFNPSLNESKWLKIQVDFLSSHRYHTQYGKEVLEPIKQKHLSALSQQI